jgi:hypothetical protein
VEGADSAAVAAEEEEEVEDELMSNLKLIW